MLVGCASTGRECAYCILDTSSRLRRLFRGLYGTVNNAFVSDITRTGLTNLEDTARLLRIV